ncbi:TEX13A [Symbiodinium natans]|uniref:TEX13A protein n=1 Tax=Symbiodinium natans TaxID=878477 RepID=A0A812MN41_9DINO|nr:TEX13A [Symbiodinium natans]
MVLVRRDGDWDCARCGNLVFAKKYECPLCGCRTAKKHNRPGKKDRDAAKQAAASYHDTGARRRPTYPRRPEEPRPAEDEAEEPMAQEDEDYLDMDEVRVEEEQLPDTPEEPQADVAETPWKRRKFGERAPPWAAPERQPNDWDCVECGAVNFQRRDACFRCHVPRYAPPPPVATSGKGIERKAGDWDCPECGVLNFMRRDICFKCGHGRPAEEEEEEEGEAEEEQAQEAYEEVDGSMAPSSPPMRPASPPASPPPAHRREGEAMKTLFRLSPKFREAWLLHCGTAGREAGDPSDPSKCERRFLVEFLDRAAEQLQSSEPSPRPSARPGASAGVQKTLSIKRSIVDRVNELNASGKLKQAIRLPGVAVCISKISEEEALEVLAQLEDLAEEVEHPTDFVKREAESVRRAQLPKGQA